MNRVYKNPTIAGRTVVPIHPPMKNNFQNCLVMKSGLIKEEGDLFHDLLFDLNFDELTRDILFLL